MKHKMYSLKTVFFQRSINGEILKKVLAARTYELLGYFHVILEVIYYYFHTNKKSEYSSKIHLLCSTVELNSYSFGNGDSFHFPWELFLFSLLSEVRFFPSDNWTVNRGLKIRPLIRTTLASTSCCHVASWMESCPSSKGHQGPWPLAVIPQALGNGSTAGWPDVTQCPTPPIHPCNASDFLKKVTCVLIKTDGNPY